MLRFLQKRKFRLVTRWKLALKDNIARVPAPQRFPFTLIFRAFDEVIHLLKLDALNAPLQGPETFLADLAEGSLPTADQYMELFLSGRDVLVDFVANDASFAALFSADERQELRSGCERIFKHLIDLEMREYARRQHSSTISE